MLDTFVTRSFWMPTSLRASYDMTRRWLRGNNFYIFLPTILQRCSLKKSNTSSPRFLASRTILSPISFCSIRAASTRHRLLNHKYRVLETRSPSCVRHSCQDGALGYLGGTLHFGVKLYVLTTTQFFGLSNYCNLSEESQIRSGPKFGGHIAANYPSSVM